MSEHKTQELAHWINEREAIRIRRAQGLAPPWTADPAMAGTRYCNVHREDDKVTQYIRGSIYSGATPDWVVTLARMINRIETLKTLAPVVDSGGIEGITLALKVLRAQGAPVFGNAYVISTCGKRMDKIDYLMRHVISQVMAREDVEWNFSSLAAFYKQLTQVDGLGSFLAGQVIADLKNTPWHPLASTPDWHSWSTHGPGSLKGLSEYYGRPSTPATYQADIKQCYDETMPFVLDYVNITTCTCRTGSRACVNFLNTLEC